MNENNYKYKEFNKNFKLEYFKYKKKYLDLKNKIVLKIIDNAYIQYGGSGETNNNEDIIDNLKRNITCPLTLSIFIDPVVAADGNTYERIEIERHFNSVNNRSPMTNAELPNINLIPNTAIKTIINNIIDMGVLDMETIKEYLIASTTSIRETQRRLNVISSNASKYHGKELNIQLEFLRITAIAVHYNFNEKGDYVKNIYVILNCDRVLLLRAIKYSFIKSFETTFEISETFLPHNLDAHIHPISESSLDNIIILNNYSLDRIKQILEQRLLSKNFYKVVKAELLPKLRVSPRINLEPVVYSFILSPYSENILKYIDKIPGFLRRDIKRVHNLTPVNMSEEIMILTRIYNYYKFNKRSMNEYLVGDKHKLLNYILHSELSNTNEISNTKFRFCGIDMIDDPNQHLMAKVGDEIESIDGSESWTKIVSDEENNFRLQNDRIAKKVNQGIRWKKRVDFYIALTGVSGVGKSYIARSLFNESDIFETDNYSKDSFSSEFTSFLSGKRFGVIVVGCRDKTFDLSFIRSNTSVQIFEFRITDYSLPQQEQHLDDKEDEEDEDDEDDEEEEGEENEEAAEEEAEEEEEEEERRRRRRRRRGRRRRREEGDEDDEDDDEDDEDDDEDDEDDDDNEELEPSLTFSNEETLRWRRLQEEDITQSNVVAFREIFEDIELESTVTGPITQTNVTFEVYLDNGRFIGFGEDHDVCFSHWITSSYGRANIESYDSIPSDATMVSARVRYLEHIEETEYGDTSHDFVFSNGDRRFSVYVVEMGGDEYYPSGHLNYNREDFLEN